MNTPRHPAAWIAVAAGLVWLVGLADRGWLAFFLAVAPGTLLLTGGLGTYVIPGDVRLQSAATVGGVLGVALSLPFLLVGVWTALWAGLLSAASFLAAGWIALSLEPDCDEVPAYPLTLRYAAKAAGDEALIFLMFTAGKRASRDEQRTPRRSSPTRMSSSSLADGSPIPQRSTGRRPLQTRWTSERALARRDLVRAHPLRQRLCARSRGPRHRALARFSRRIEPRTSGSFVTRGEPRPWILCIHGYGMGTGRLDLEAFEVEWLHRHLGLNVALPVLADARPTRARPAQRSGILRHFAPELRARRGAGDVGLAPAARMDPCAREERASAPTASRSAVTRRRFSPRSRRISRARSPAFRPRTSSAERCAS